MKKIIAMLLALVLMLSTAALAEFEEIKRGDKGDRVKEIQTYLKDEGFLSGKADGDFGGGTEKAVIAFQNAKGMVATGVVDEATYNSLAGIIPPEDLIPIDLDRVRPVTLDAGDDHYVGLREDGTVIAYYDDDDMEDYDGQCEVQDWTDIISIAAGGYHTVGLKSNGTVVAVGMTRDKATNVKSWTGIIDIAAGSQHTVGLKMDGTLVVTGANDNRQCEVSGWTDIVDVACGSWHTLGVKADGTVVAVGLNEYGQCNVSGWTDIVAVEGGDWFTVGLKSDGTVVYAGSFDSRARMMLDGVKRWSDIVSIHAYSSNDVFGIRADGKIEDLVGRWGGDGSNYTAAAFSSWRNKAAYLKKDGTVESRFEAFDGVKLKQPYLHTLAVEEEPVNKDPGVWLLKAYVDEFDLPTDEYYIANGTAFTGTFSNSATTNSELTSYIFSSKSTYDYKEYDSLRVRLVEYGRNVVNNPYSRSRDYDVVIMDGEGRKYYTSGTMYSESKDVYMDDEQILLDALKKGGTVRLAITESDNSLNKYIITIPDATGFDVVYYDLWND